MPEIYGIAGEYAARVFGGVIASRDTVKVIGTTQSVIVANDSERVSILMMNLSSNVIYVGMNEAVGSNNGIILGVNGGFVTMDITNRPVLTGRGWHAVAAGAASNLFVAYEYRVQRLNEGG